MDSKCFTMVYVALNLGSKCFTMVYVAPAWVLNVLKNPQRMNLGPGSGQPTSLDPFEGCKLNHWSMNNKPLGLVIPNQLVHEQQTLRVS